jgi:hypothetical protein
MNRIGYNTESHSFKKPYQAPPKKQRTQKRQYYLPQGPLLRNMPPLGLLLLPFPLNPPLNVRVKTKVKVRVVTVKVEVGANELPSEGTTSPQPRHVGSRLHHFVVVWDILTEDHTSFGWSERGIGLRLPDLLLSPCLLGRLFLPRIYVSSGGCSSNMSRILLACLRGAEEFRLLTASSRSKGPHHLHRRSTHQNVYRIRSVNYVGRLAFKLVLQDGLYHLVSIQLQWYSPNLFMCWLHIFLVYESL